MQTCMPVVAENGSCAAGEPCDLFLQCIDGTCQRGAGPMAACDPAHPCNLWVDGQFCNAAMVCEAVIVAAPGEMCGTVMDKPAYCAGGASCSPVSSTCIAPAEDDAGCGGTANRGCYVPRRCIDGTCQLPDAANCGAGGSGGSGGAGGA
jgi:hypothetical protein